MRLALLAALALPALAPADWLRFRGPNGTGVADAPDVPISFDAKNYRWKKEIPGLGNSSPIVVGDKVFLQSSSKDSTQRFLYCLDAKTGDLKWSYSLPGGKAKTHQKNSMASSTPASDGKSVFAVFWDGSDITLAACDLAGKELWKRPLGSFKSRHGAGLSPIVSDGKVILALDQDGHSVVSAFDAKTRDTVWQTPRKATEDCSYSTPFVHSPDGKEASVIVGTTAGVAAYREKDGKELWKYDWKFPGQPLRVVASPVLAAGSIIVTSGNGGGNRAAVAVKADASGETAWTTKRTVPYVPCFVVKGDHLYGVNDVGQAVCIDAKTGEEVFVERLAGSFTSSPVLVNGNVYAVNETGEVFVFAAKPTFELLGKSEIGEQVYASPAVGDGALFIRGGKTLFCIGKAK